MVLVCAVFVSRTSASTALCINDRCHVSGKMPRPPSAGSVYCRVRVVIGGGGSGSKDIHKEVEREALPCADSVWGQSAQVTEAVKEVEYSVVVAGAHVVRVVLCLLARICSIVALHHPLV